MHNPSIGTRWNPFHGNAVSAAPTSTSWMAPRQSYPVSITSAIHACRREGITVYFLVRLVQDVKPTAPAHRAVWAITESLQADNTGHLPRLRRWYETWLRVMHVTLLGHSRGK